MSELISDLNAYNQHHISALIPDLQPNSRIIEQLKGIDLADIQNRLTEAEGWAKNVSDPQPIDKTYVWENMDTSEQERVEEVGKAAIRAGKVAAVIMSGGQGTRLGYSGPKGCYNIGLPSKKSIFQVHMERLARVSALAHTNPLPVYIMTSYLNDTVIRDFFDAHDYWGYPRDAVYFFEQGLEPCLTTGGKLIVEDLDTLSMAPDGNGGIYSALEKSGAISNMLEQGVEHLHVYGIDNVLTKSCDPRFLGLCIDNDTQVGNKVVWRASKSEKVGVSVCRGDRMEIIEYSEIPAGVADATDDHGKLKYGGGNICNHYMTLSFVQEILTQLNKVYHLAKKKIPYWDTVTHSTVVPEESNGYKFELFIFDVFPLASRWLVMEVKREDEFAPVKNAPGSKMDAPEHAAAMLSAQAEGWLRAAGASIVREDEVENDEGDAGTTSMFCEVSPTLSYAGEGLEQYAGTNIVLPCYLSGL